MAMGTRQKRQRQEELWVATTTLARPASHPFYERLNRLLDESGFDEFVEQLCQPFYAATMGRPGLVPGIYFRLLLVGYFEGIDSERGIAWRASDSLGIRSFLRIALDETGPDHSTISRTRRLIDLETHQAVFAWILAVLAEQGLLRGKTLGIDATEYRAARQRGSLRGFPEAVGKGIGNRDADASTTGEAGSEAAQERIQRGVGPSA
jgi:transposase